MTTTPLAARRAIALAVSLCAGALVTACGSSGNSAGPSTTPTVTASPSSAPASQTPTPVPPVSSAAPSGPQPCPTRDLAAKLGLSQGTAGSVYQVIDFTNISNVTCTLYGYPGVSLAGGTPVNIIGAPADENPATPRALVTLAPGAVANALLRIVDAGNFAASKCGPVQSAYLQIFPPNQTTPIFLAYSSQACSKAAIHLLTVDAVKPGSGG
ncbi:MAG TPA: DUF4232 domain-containing protein [Streptosporangiaceae bacterium]